MLPAPSFGLVACLARLRLLFKMIFFCSLGGNVSFASAACCLIFAWFSFRVAFGLKVTGATSCPSTVLRPYLRGCFSRGGIGWYRTSLLNRVCP